MSKKATECKTEGCHRKQASRGRCTKCRTAVSVRVSRGEFTDEQAVKMGLLDPKEPAGRKPDSPMGKAIARARVVHK